MTAKKPSEFQPELTDERLSQVAGWLLEEWYATEDDLVRDTDNAYTRGTTRFGRQCQRILNEFLSKKYGWLGIANNGLDLVFLIGGVPCRFSNDSIEAPTKRAVLEIHPYQMSLIEDSEPNDAVRFCFVIDPGFDDVMAPRVEFLGFTASDIVVCRWQSDAGARTFVDVKATPPESVEVTKPVVTPKRKDDDAEADDATS